MVQGGVYKSDAIWLGRPAIEWVSVAHFGARRIRPFADKPKTDRRAAMGTFSPDGFDINKFELILLEPHQLEALGAATDLR